MPVTAKRKRVADQQQDTEALQSLLSQANEELAQTRAFFEQVQLFSDLVRKAKLDLRKLTEKEATLKAELADVKAELRSVQNLIESSNDAMLQVLEPGPAQFLPMFDRMEPADPKVHGKNAARWREEPIAVLRLSPVASQALIAADMLFIGQLQDRILDDPESWWTELDAMTEAMAAAVADKLADFREKGGVE